MTIKKSQDWGETVARPKDLEICETDAAASQLLTKHHLRKQAFPAIAIIKSDLARALGTTGADPKAERMQATPFDLIEISFDGELATEQIVLGLGYGLLRKSWWHGEIVAAMNTSFIGDWDCAPRSHPNDGKFDLLTVTNQMNATQRLIASRRLKHATHLPHPQISVKQSADYEANCKARPNLYVDNQKFSRISQCRFRLLPDALTLYW